jgi:hypothetical protein
MKDKQIYPYRPQEFGISPEELKIGQRGKSRFFSGSGDVLEVFRTPDSLTISIPDDSSNDFHLSAWLGAHGELALGLRTRGLDGQRHPDFRARPFVELAITEVFKGRFKLIKGLWLSHGNSDN